MTKIAPSILSADFSKLGEDIKSIGSAEYIHIDVMDGMFVPNISFGLPVVKNIRKTTDQVFDVHLMIVEPQKYAERFCDAGADIVTVHVEASTEENIISALKTVRRCGKLSGLSVKPGTPAEALLPFLEYTDMILVMTVEPGFGGQSFMPEQLDKIRRIKEFTDIPIEVDGGINLETGALCVEAGAEILVAGSFVFKAEDRNGIIDALRCV